MADSAKKTAKKAPAKKSVKKSSSTSKVKLGDTLFVPTDPRRNNGASEAPATVTQVLDVKGEDRVNLKVASDSEAVVRLTNVLVVTRQAAKKAQAEGHRVAFRTAS